MVRTQCLICEVIGLSLQMSLVIVFELVFHIVKQLLLQNRQLTMGKHVTKNVTNCVLLILSCDVVTKLQCDIY